MYHFGLTLINLSVMKHDQNNIINTALDYIGISSSEWFSKNRVIDDLVIYCIKFFNSKSGSRIDERDIVLLNNGVIDYYLNLQGLYLAKIEVIDLVMWRFLRGGISWFNLQLSTREERINACFDQIAKSTLGRDEITFLLEDRFLEYFVIKQNCIKDPMLTYRINEWKKELKLIELNLIQYYYLELAILKECII